MDESGEQNLNKRYQRQIVYPNLGIEGQRKLGDASAIVVGCGALGTAIADILTRAGIGRIKLIDRDTVELSNLQRQALFDMDDISDALPKAEAARRKLNAINPIIEIMASVVSLSPANIEEQLEGFDIILDGTDNFHVRFLLNDAALKLGIPWIYGGVLGASGMTYNILPGKTFCFRCLFGNHGEPGNAQTCATVGIIASAPRVIAAVQALEAMKYLAGKHDAMRKSILTVDLWNASFSEITVAEYEPSMGCIACKEGTYEYLDHKDELIAEATCGGNTVQVNPPRKLEFDLKGLAEMLQPLGKVTLNPYFIKFSDDEYQITIYQDGRAQIRGTEDVEMAKSIYIRYLGG